MPLKYKINLLTRIAPPLPKLLQPLPLKQLNPIEQVEIVKDARDVGVGDEEEEEVPDEAVVVEGEHFVGLLVVAP